MCTPPLVPPTSMTVNVGVPSVSGVWSPDDQVAWAPPEEELEEEEEDEDEEDDEEEELELPPLASMVMPPPMEKLPLPPLEPPTTKVPVPVCAPPVVISGLAVLIFPPLASA